LRAASVALISVTRSDYQINVIRTLGRPGDDGFDWPHAHMSDISNTSVPLTDVSLLAGGAARGAPPVYS
jgi:hypothetical protein